MHRASRQLLLIKMSHLFESSKVQHQLNHDSFHLLVKHIRQEFATELCSNTQRISILHALLRLKHVDFDTLSLTADLIKQQKFNNLNQLTHVLYLLAKFRFRAESNEYIEVAMTQLKKEPKLDVKLACRNLWNLFALDHRSEVGLQLFAEVLLRVGEAYKLTELDLANSIRAFSHFQYKHERCIELLLKQSIKTANEMDLRSLAVIVSSFVDLGIPNPTLLAITKETLLKSIDLKADHLTTVQDLNPTDCT